jgi:homoserine kinase
LKRVLAYGPACIGNVAAGFDVLGAAVAPAGGELWGDVVEIAELPGAPAVTLTCEGPFAHLLPADPADNLAVIACEAVARRLGRPLPRLALRLRKGLPVGSGLGSSSATVVAVVRALDVLLGRPLDEAGLLAAAGEAEAHASGAPHLDNVAAALLGGLRLVDPGGRARLLPFPEELRFVLAVPELTLTTRAARAALPEAVPLGLAVAHAQNLAALVHALHAADRQLLRACLRDLLAEPWRAGLVPGFRAVQAAGLAAGAWGCSLSGAGPSAFAVAPEGAAPAVGEAMRQAWAAAGVVAEVRLCVLDGRGARRLPDAALGGPAAAAPEPACG